MASMKAKVQLGSQLFGQGKKEPAVAKAADGGAKAPASKAAPKKAAAAPKAPAPKKVYYTSYQLFSQTPWLHILAFQSPPCLVNLVSLTN